jgi:hypothetical protein
MNQMVKIEFEAGGDRGIDKLKVQFTPMSIYLMISHSPFFNKDRFYDDEQILRLEREAAIDNFLHTVKKEMLMALVYTK